MSDKTIFPHVLHKIKQEVQEEKIVFQNFPTIFLSIFLQDTPNAHRGKHIVFDSDNDGDVEEASSSGEESEDADRKNQNQQVQNINKNVKNKYNLNHVIHFVICYVGGVSHICTVWD